MENIQGEKRASSYRHSSIVCKFDIESRWQKINKVTGSDGICKYLYLVQIYLKSMHSFAVSVCY